MIEQCKEYLIQRITEAGIKSKVYTSRKKLEASNESHIGAVLFEGDDFERSGAKTNYLDELGIKRKRVKIFDRKTSFFVVIGEYDQVKCESIFETFIGLLGPGILINDNFTAIEVEGAEWVDENDSVLKAKVAVQVKIRFDGGLYKDSTPTKLKEFDLTIEVEGENDEQS